VGASLDIIKKDIESSTQASVRRAFAGETLSERQENILAEMGAQAAAIFKEDLGAESLERDFVEIYRKALTQPEVDGLIAFYKTDAGKALLVKMPAVSQQTIRITLARLQGLTPKLNVMQSEIIRRMREEK
jgi:hypothetical protein